MKSPASAIKLAGLFLSGMVSAAALTAGEPVVSGKVADKAVVIPPPAESRWSLGAGVLFRQFDADFRIRPVGGAVPFGRNSSGRGDVGLHGAGENVIRYDDGSVGPGYGVLDGNTPDGTSYTIINSPGQLTPTGRVDGVGDDIYSLAFHTHRAYNTSSYSSQSFESSDEDDAAGPYVELRYALIPGGNMDVNILFGYSYANADLSSGTGVLANQSVHRRTTNYTYNYDYDVEGAGVFDPGATFPFVDGAYSIIDPNGSYAQGGQYIAPRKSSKSSSRKIASYIQLGEADIDVDLHELVLAPEVYFDLCSRVHVGLAAGPTLNFINSDFGATAAWYKSGSSKPLRTYRVNESTDDVELGVMGQLTLTVDITQSIFIQASGSYRYVPTVDVGAGFAKAELDASSFTGAVGLGIRF